MRYSKEFKLECIAQFRAGKWPQTPKTIKNPEDFHGMIRRWSRMEQAKGPDVFDRKRQFRTPGEKLELISRVIAGESMESVAIENGMEPGTFQKMVQAYKTLGYNGLLHAKGKSSTDQSMKKDIKTSPLTESEREELIRLRAENEYIKTEIEVLKKKSALRQEKWAAQLKEKKQQSLKNSGKMDTN